MKSILPDFQRYRKGEMTNRERNSFERELQKDPFAEEAEEGFASISPDEASTDLTSLHSRLRKRVQGRRSFAVYRIAASVAVLMVISSIFIFVERNKSGKQLSDTQVKNELSQNTENMPAAAPEKKDTESENSEKITFQKPEKTVSQKIRKDKEIAIAPVADIKPDEAMSAEAISKIDVKSDHAYLGDNQASVPLVVMTSKKSLPERNRAAGTVISSEDNMPVPGATVYLKGTSQAVVTDTAGNFNIALPDSASHTLVADYIGMQSKEFNADADSHLRVSLDPSSISLSEIIVVGYGAKRFDSQEEEPVTGYTPPLPVNGKADFDKYIHDNIQRPDSATSGQRVVVVLSFLVNTNGTPDSIKIVRSPGKPFSDEATRLIKEGPAWKPAEENGRLIEDEVRLRIIFR